MPLLDPRITTLGADPNTQHRTNCNSFQQSGLLSYRGYQYGVFYTTASPPIQSEPEPEPVPEVASDQYNDHELKRHAEAASNQYTESDSNQNTAYATTVTREPSVPARHVNVARRRIGAEKWDVIVLQDHEQNIDDGHNTISLGLCTGDGTLHLAFDAHCEGLEYRGSKAGVAGRPKDVSWTVEDVGFSDVLGILPGTEGDDDARGMVAEITYSRFLSVGRDLVCEWRIGMAGKGSCVMFRYGIDDADETWKWRFLGRYLVGEGCSPYINGLSWEPARENGEQDEKGIIHVSWTNRYFIEYDDESGDAHKQQAGPNGPENNADLGYMWSHDCGRSWKNGAGHTVADLRHDRMAGAAISTQDQVMMMSIPKNSGIMNQEAQCVNVTDGSFHILMRDTRLTGTCMWRHTWRNAEGHVNPDVIEGVVPAKTGSRGSIAADGRTGTVYFVLPGNLDHSMVVGTRKLIDAKTSEYGNLEIVWKGDGYDGEPLIDESLLQQEGVLSVMNRTAEESRNVIVLEFVDQDGMRTST